MQIKVLKRLIKDKMFGKTTDTALGAQVAQMSDARMGAMYMLATTEITKVATISNAHFFKAFVVGTEPFSDFKKAATGMLDKTDAMVRLKNSRAAHKLSKAAEKAGEVTAAMKAKLQKLFSDFFRTLLDKVQHVYGDLLFGAEWIAEAGTWLISDFAGNLAKLIPPWAYVRKFASIYSAGKKAVLKSNDLISQIYKGRGVELLGGHPAIISNALAQHSAKGALGGIKDFTMGVAGLGIKIAGDAAAGAGALLDLVGLITSVLERIIKLVDFFVQRSLVNKVLERAKKEWNNRHAQSSLVNDHKMFSEWFQGAVSTTPIIAALVMGSGFVAHPYKFAQLLTPKLEVVSQGEFDKAVVYIDKLKSLSGKYVEEYTKSYLIDFTSKDGVVDARLNELKKGKGLLEGREFASATKRKPRAGKTVCVQETSV